MPYSAIETAGFERGEIELGGYRHTYYVSDVDETRLPPVLAIHGFGTDGYRTYRHIVEPARRAGIPLIAIDLLGFGGSDAPDIRYSLDHYAELLRDLCDATGLSERPIVLGHSMGGKVAAAAAAMFEERFSGLVLVNSGGFTRRENLIPLLGSLPLFHRLIDSDVVYRHVLPRTPLGAIFNSDVSRHQSRRMRTSHASLDLRRTGIRSKLAELTLPTLVIWGGNDRILSRNAPRSVRRHLPPAMIRVIQDAGHAPMKDQPEEFVDIIAGFAARHISKPHIHTVNDRGRP